MIKPFKIEDLGSFIPNEYSSPEVLLSILSTEAWEAKTLWGTDGMVQAIICFNNYWGNCWSCFVLVSKNVLPSSIMRLRALIQQYMLDKSASRLQTESRATATLQKWHRFLGFRHEGTKRKMMFNQDYDCWAIVSNIGG